VRGFSIVGVRLDKVAVVGMGTPHGFQDPGSLVVVDRVVVGTGQLDQGVHSRLGFVGIVGKVLEVHSLAVAAHNLVDHRAAQAHTLVAGQLLGVDGL